MTKILSSKNRDSFKDGQRARVIKTHFESEREAEGRIGFIVSSFDDSMPIIASNDEPSFYVYAEEWELVGDDAEKNPREDIIDEALGYVTKDRNAAHGNPEDNFSRIAEIWNAQGLKIDGRDLNATDVALLMAGMKLARLRFNPNHRDSWTDTIGYAACGWETVVKKEQK